MRVHDISVALHVPEPWRPVPDEDHLRWSHPTGARLVAKVRAGDRTRLELTCLPAESVAHLPPPTVTLDSEHPLVGWLAGASAEVVALTPSGPVHAVQRRGFCSGTLAELGLFPEPLVVAPGHPLTSHWVVERLPGDLLTLPPEPDWVPGARYLADGEELELCCPDGVVTGVGFQECDDGFRLVDRPGLHVAEVGGPTGITRLEVGWFADWRLLLAGARARAEGDLWCYLTSLCAQPDLDELDVRLAQALEEPTLWAVLAAGQAVGLGLIGWEQARRAAERTLPTLDLPGKLALVARGLAEVGCVVGERLGARAYEGLARFGFGRLVTGYPDGAERELLPVGFWLAGLGEGPLGVRVGAMLARASARARCRASETFDPQAVAWLSLEP